MSNFQTLLKEEPHDSITSKYTDRLPESVEYFIVDSPVPLPLQTLVISPVDILFEFWSRWHDNGILLDCGANSRLLEYNAHSAFRIDHGI